MLVPGEMTTGLWGPEWGENEVWCIIAVELGKFPAPLPSRNEPPWGLTRVLGERPGTGDARTSKGTGSIPRKEVQRVLLARSASAVRSSLAAAQAVAVAMVSKGEPLSLTDPVDGEG